MPSIPQFPRSAPVLVTHVSHWDDAAAAYVTAEYVARPLGAIRVAAAGTYRIVASSTPHPNYPTVISMKRSPDCSPMRGATLNYSGRSASVGYGTPIGSLKRGRTTYNDGFIRPLDAAELLGILKSVLRYRDKWCEHGHQQSFLFRQALRGRKGGTASGLARLVNVSDRDRFIVAQLDAGGESYRAIALAFGVHVGTVQGARARLMRGVYIEANTDSGGS